MGIGILGWIQGQVLTPLGTVLTPKETELMADCFAGAFTAAANLAGLLEEGDLAETVVALVQAGGVDIPWFDPTGHGTAGQRIDAFNLGFAQGTGSPDACTDDSFFATFPAPPATA